MSAKVSPFGVVADSQGNFYIAELGTNRIRKVDTSGKITTAIGDGNQGFAGDGGPPNKVQMSGPTSVALDGSGNLYFVDSLNFRIRKLAGGNVTTVIGNGLLSRSGDNGPAANAQLNLPLGVAVDGAGNVYIADNGNNAIKELQYAFVDSTARLEGLAAGNDDLPVVLPATANLGGPFAPTSDQPWLNIVDISNGVVSFAFTTNTGPARTARGPPPPSTNQAAGGARRKRAL